MVKYVKKAWYNSNFLNYRYWSENQFHRVWSEVYSMDQKIFAIGSLMMWKKFKF